MQQWMKAKSILDTSYGPEMRGGTANCTVIVADREIGSPVVSQPSCVVVMNLPSLDKFEDAVKPGGVLVVNSSLVTREPGRQDVTIVKVPATQIASELGRIELLHGSFRRRRKLPGGNTGGCARL